MGHPEHVSVRPVVALFVLGEVHGKYHGVFGIIPLANCGASAAPPAKRLLRVACALTNDEVTVVDEVKEVSWKTTHTFQGTKSCLSGFQVGEVRIFRTYCQ